MAKIAKADYTKIKSQAERMRTEGKTLNTKMTAAFTELKNMANSWKGKRYNTLVGECNKVVDTINEMLKLVVTDIPSTLEGVAGNYAKASGASSISVSNEKPTNVTKLTTTPELPIVFDSSKVETSKGNVQKNFNDAKKKMDDINSAFNTLKQNWDSDAATAFQKKFSTLKSSVDSAITNINTQFGNLIQAAKTDIENAEKANTIS